MARLDSDVTFENVKQTILPFLTEEMLLKLKEEEDEVERRSKRIALDTGSSLMMAPEADVAAILE